jgi:hypothetical protein
MVDSKDPLAPSDAGIQKPRRSRAASEKKGAKIQAGKKDAKKRRQKR